MERLVRFLLGIRRGQARARWWRGEMPPGATSWWTQR
jgi:hypothetical protein